MSTQLIRPSHAQRLEIRCNVGDAIVANLAVHIVFFFERRLDTKVLSDAFAHALTNLPIFAGRMALVDGSDANPMWGAGCALHDCVVGSHAL